MKKTFLIMLAILISTPAFADPNMVLGLEVYNNKAQCGSCHTLQAAGSKSTIGPNFDQLKPQTAQIILAVVNGIGLMPPFEGILTSDEIEAVAYYVSKKTKQ